MTAVQPTEEVWRYGTRDLKGWAGLTAMLVVPFILLAHNYYRYHGRETVDSLVIFYFVVSTNYVLKWRNLRVSVGAEAITKTDNFGRTKTIKFSDILYFRPDHYVGRDKYEIGSATGKIVLTQDLPNLKSIVDRVEQKRLEAGNYSELRYGSWVLEWPKGVGTLSNDTTWQKVSRVFGIRAVAHIVAAIIVPLLIGIAFGRAAFIFWAIVGAIYICFVFVRFIWNTDLNYGYAADHVGLHEINWLRNVSRTVRYSEIEHVQYLPPEPWKSIGAYKLNFKEGTITVADDFDSRRLLVQIRQGMEAAGHGDQFPAVPD